MLYTGRLEYKSKLQLDRIDGAPAGYLAAPCPALEDQASLRPVHGVCGAGLQLASKLPLHDKGSSSLPQRDFPAIDQEMGLWSRAGLGHTPLSRVTGQQVTQGWVIPPSRVTGSIGSFVSINCVMYCCIQVTWGTNQDYSLKE